MRTAILAALLIFAGIGIALGAWWYANQRDASPEQPGTVIPGTIFPGGTHTDIKPVEADAQVRSAIEDVFKRENPYAGTLTLSETVVLDGYALAIFEDENVGGMAAFKVESDGTWTLLGTDGGAFSPEGLAELGVPLDIGRRLVPALK